MVHGHMYNRCKKWRLFDFKKLKREEEIKEERREGIRGQEYLQAVTISLSC